MRANLRVEPMRFRRTPLAATAVCFALGIACAHLQLPRIGFTPTPLLLAALVLLGILSLLALRRGPLLAESAVTAAWLVLGFAAAEWQPSTPTPVALMHYADNLSRTVTGRVVRVHTPPPDLASLDAAAQADRDQVPPWESSEEALPATNSNPSVDLALDSIEDVTPDTSTMVPISGGIRVTLYDPGANIQTLRCGDRLELPLRLKPPQRFRDPGAFQYGDYMLTQGIALQAGVSAARVQVLGTTPPTWRCRLAGAQSWASERLLSLVDSAPERSLPRVIRLDRTDARMLGAMLFGDRTGLTHALRTGFERTGTFHLFVVSGLHVALLAGGVFWLLTRLRLPPGLATILTIAAAVAYTALTGFGQPAQRALVMTSVYLLARLLSRTRDALNALGAAVLALLVWSPSSLFDASFQMTALVIVAIGGIAIPLGQWSFLRFAHATRDVFLDYPVTHLDPRESQLVVMLELWGEAVADILGERARRLPALLVRALLWTLELALIGIVTELVMVLPMAVYFHRAAVLALPANMVVLPVVAFVATSAVATFLCSLLSPWLALVPSMATALLLHGVTWAIHRISHLAAADFRAPGPVWWVAALALTAWAACCWAVRRSARAALAVTFALPLVAAFVLWPEPAVTTPATLEITAIDVGQGDSLLAINPDGRTMLIDAGGPVGHNGLSEVVANFDIGEQVVAPYLWSRRLRRLDILVLTHAHTDHMGGMPAILEDFRPRELWVGIDSHSPLYAALVADASRLGIPVRHLHSGDRVSWGKVDISVLSPAVTYRNQLAPRNDDSLVLQMNFGKASALLEGDAEKPSEEAMLAAGLVHPVTLLKVAHHGSRTSTTQPFLDAASPRDAVVSVGLHNTFGHPRGEVIARLAACGTRLFRTDQFGLTTFLLTSDGSIREVVDGTPVTAPSLGPK